MHIEFTPALTIALEWATAFARRDQSRVVEPRHLLAGLLHEDEGACAVLLKGAGLDFERYRQTLGELPSSADHGGQLGSFASQLADVFAEARDSARWHAEDGSLTSDMVLRALLSADSHLRDMLAGFGFDFLQLDATREATVVPLDEPLDLGEPGEWIDLARVLDAAANRAREALRVLEDYARLVLNDSFLSRKLKDSRHELTIALNDVALLPGRDTQRDVGTQLTGEGEAQRDSFRDVVRANSCRAQEALRSLEEFGKMRSADLGKMMESLRYRVYTLELALTVGGEARTRLADARLYVLATDAQCRASLAGTVREALAGGAQIIQLREKGAEDRTILDRAKDVRRLTHEAGALFIMNDRPDLAVLAAADGVHLGQDDLTVRQARTIVGDKMLIGVSTHNIAQLRQAILDGAHYLGVGPAFASSTKGFETLAGLEYVRQAAAETSLPFFVLGGVTAKNLSEVFAAGGRRVAVAHAVCAADDPQAAARELKQALMSALGS